jgi:hypothetical protein
MSTLGTYLGPKPDKAKQNKIKNKKRIIHTWRNRTKSKIFLSVISGKCTVHFSYGKIL